MANVKLPLTVRAVIEGGVLQDVTVVDADGHELVFELVTIDRDADDADDDEE